MDAYIFDRSVLNWLSSLIVAAGALTLILVTWCILKISSIQSAEEEFDDYTFNEVDPSIFDEEFYDCETVISDTVVRACS